MSKNKTPIQAPRLKGQHAAETGREEMRGQFFRVFDALLQGFTLHRYIAQNELLVGNLNSRISEINQTIGKGYIHSQMIAYTTRFGQTIHIKKYWIPPKKLTELHDIYDVEAIRQSAVYSLVKYGAPRA